MKTVREAEEKMVEKDKEELWVDYENVDGSFEGNLINEAYNDTNFWLPLLVDGAVVIYDQDKVDKGAVIPMAHCITGSKNKCDNTALLSMGPQDHSASHPYGDEPTLHSNKQTALNQASRRGILSCTKTTQARYGYALGVVTPHWPPAPVMAYYEAQPRSSHAEWAIMDMSGNGVDDQLVHSLLVSENSSAHLLRVVGSTTGVAVTTMVQDDHPNVGVIAHATSMTTAGIEAEDWRSLMNFLSSIRTDADVPSGTSSPKVLPKSRRRMKGTTTASSKKKSKAKKVASPTGIVKPLTPYNFYFRFERNRLLQCIDTIKDPSTIKHLRDDDLIQFIHQHLLPVGFNDHYSWTPDNSVEEQRNILQEQWGRDASVKRVHCKSHGRFTFSTLTKYIAKRWRTMPLPAKSVFRAISAEDYKRYKQEISQPMKEK